MNTTLAAKLWAQYAQQRVLLICARYQYRGIVTGAGSDWIELSEVAAIEEMGPAGGKAPKQADPIPGKVIIQTAFVEFVGQLWGDDAAR